MGSSLLQGTHATRYQAWNTSGCGHQVLECSLQPSMVLVLVTTKPSSATMSQSLWDSPTPDSAISLMRSMPMAQLHLILQMSSPIPLT
jgi:hypothetical protein